jgi:hypothetical protein
MYAKGIEPWKVAAVIDDVSEKCFAGNLKANRAPEYYRGKAVRFTLRVKDCRAPGHRLGMPHPWRDRNGRGYKPRRMVAACYHAYGEVIRGLLDSGAEWVQTAPITLERYRSKGAKPLRWTRETWKDHADAMAYLNIGSDYSPFTFAEACECGATVMPDEPRRYEGSEDWKGRPDGWPVNS